MDEDEERAESLDMRTRYLAGERLPGIKYRYNSEVSFPDGKGSAIEGWIVAVEPTTPEPVYTIERSDGLGDNDVPESDIQLILDPHEGGG